MEAMNSDPLFLSFQQALAGRYSIDRELGRGGMGVVYLAREVHLDRLVAIKLLPPERAGETKLRARFLREARLAAKLSHPNIIPIHSVEDTGEFVFYVMAFVDGETLAERVRQRGPLPISEGARVLREVAWALAYAHGQGLVHQDVKPDNILLESSTGRVLVADFGIAAAVGDAGAEGVCGTPEFMSPEQSLNGRIDSRSDLYGLGATAFYAFSGRLPFEGKSHTEVLAKQVTQPPPPLASLGLAVPRKLASLVDRCLAKDPGHRPASAQALADELSLALEQRRELPAALRAFVKRHGRLNGGGTLIAGAALLPGSIIMSALFGGGAGFATFLLGMTAVPFAYLTGAARRLTLLGYTHQDVGPAFQAEVDQAREELMVEHHQAPTFIETWLGRGAKLSGVALGVTLLSWFLNVGDLNSGLGVIVTLSGMATFMTSIGYLALVQRHRDVDTEFWSRLWTGRLGRLVFSVARKLAGNRSRESAMTHRATELSLGMAAEQLFESLPKETRLALAGLPAVLRRLQGDAQLLRKRYDQLQEALGAAGGESSAELADLRTARDTTHARLADAVGGLETMRLNLLRLHAGSATVAGVTTHIALAAEVSERVERLIAANEEIEMGLKFPRPVSVTPT
jgi:eukaryotic-like serine/threonine-protein kinase